MTADDTTPQTSADVIERASDVMYEHANGGLYDPMGLARALADAHLLTDPAERDELIYAREVAELAEKDRRTYHQDAIRAEAEVAVLRATVDRVRALINDPEAASLRHHANGDFTWVIEITALNAALDGGEQP